MGTGRINVTSTSPHERFGPKDWNQHAHVAGQSSNRSNPRVHGNLFFSIYLSIYLYLSICLSTNQSIYLSVYLSIIRLLFWTDHIELKQKPNMT